MFCHGRLTVSNLRTVYTTHWKFCHFHTISGSSCDILQLGNSSSLIQRISSKPYINKKNVSSFFTLPGVSSKKKEYSARKVVGFTMEEIYSVVQDVENYRDFVPFCTKSVVHIRKPEQLSGELEIGFPPILESYTSRVTLVRPRLVQAVCTDGRLFDHLVTTWRFNPGLKQEPRSCLIDFYVSFEFKSLLHSQLAHMFFNELVRQMESAFFREAEKRYGQPSIKVIKIKPPS
ncbi:unnamed protein product [Nezara viridula]|uniref:Coenzyme Q-binding protein COQ10 START domain-containing protein n=1 Tax=Nezara viridula TaxID=85310 RepID=A0A9P0H8Y7_NEZVI|nr:unnamed protein product [Nezara viridula]